MQIKTCEEYVLDRLHETEKKLDEADRNNEFLLQKLQQKNDDIARLREFIKEFSNIERFDSGDNFKFTVSNIQYCSQEERDAFDMLCKLFPDTPVRDYRTNKPEDKHDEGETT